MKKRFLSLALVLAFLLLPGCSGGKNSPSPSSLKSTSSPESTLPASTLTSDPTTVPALKPTVDYITIKGEQYSTELTELLLMKYGLTDADIEPLKHMTNLTDLSLFYNQISDISPLAGLTNLTSLDLRSNQIKDISALAGLTNLTDIELGYNQVIDASPLAGLTKLTYLALTDNQISDIHMLSGLSLLKNLVLFGNPNDEQQLKELHAALPNCIIT